MSAILRRNGKGLFYNLIVLTGLILLFAFSAKVQPGSFSSPNQSETVRIRAVQTVSSGFTQPDRITGGSPFVLKMSNLPVTGETISFNQPPNQPTTPVPVNNGVASSTSPAICATVSDPDGDNLTVRYFGRKKTSLNTRFTIIGLPDTQFYTEEVQGTNSSGGGHNGIFKSQTQWIANHRVDSSIAFVVQLGDCVQNGDNPPGSDNRIEWKRADTAMKNIESPNVPVADGIPYGICVGNHDQWPIANPDGNSTYYNEYFGQSRFNGRAYYGGHYGANNDNHYELFSAGGIDFIHISIEYYPNGTTASLQPVLDWADGLLKTFYYRKGIFSTHNMLTTGNPANFQGPGLKIYNDLKDNPNLFLMLAGHVSGEGRRTDVYNGNTVHTVMSDYQSGYSNGGNGFLRIMQFLPGQNLLKIKTYSPYSGISLTGPGSDFSLPVNIVPGFSLIGTNTNVVSASSNCMLWPGLEPLTDYEWYVEVSDGTDTITGPVWAFKTPANGPLPVNLSEFKAMVVPGSKVKLEWTTSGEKDNSFFDIERSGDAVNFSNIGRVPGFGNYNGIHKYVYYDKYPMMGISYYRLKQVDINSRFSYSEVKNVKISDTDNSFDIFPNPARKDEIKIYSLKNIQGSIDVMVYDINGRLNLQQMFNDTNTFTIKHSLQTGIYTVKITGNNLSETKKLVIQ